MARSTEATPRHPQLTRRLAVQAGAVGLLGLGIEHLGALRALGGPATANGRDDRAVIYIFLSGGLSQLDSFDLKPDAPADIRGEFRPIATRTPGLDICEHLPKLAERSNLWSLVRSLTHSSNDHSAGHQIMLSGRSDLPPGFNPSKPRPSDWPSIASIAGALCPPRNNLPPAVVLPEKLIHNTGRVIPGQFGGEMGPKHDPWFIEASPFDPTAYGAYPSYRVRPPGATAAGRQDQAVPDARASACPKASPRLGSPAGWDCSRPSTASARRSRVRRRPADSTTSARGPSRC